MNTLITYECKEDDGNIRYSYIPIDMDPTTCEHADGIDDRPVSAGFFDLDAETSIMGIRCDRGRSLLDIIAVKQSILYRAVLWLLISGFLAMKGGGVEVVVI